MQDHKRNRFLQKKLVPFKKQSRMKRYVSLINTICLCVMALLLLGGCQKRQVENSAGSRMEFQKKGVIKVTSIESFEREYYDEKELEQIIEETAEEVGKGVKINKFGVKNGLATLIVTYQSDDDYRAFNDVRLFYGTVEEALAEGYDFSPLYGSVSIRDSSHLMTDAYLEGLKDKTVIITPESGEIHFSQSPLFASANIQVMEDGQAFVSGKTSEDDPGILIME